MLALSKPYLTSRLPADVVCKQGVPRSDEDRGQTPSPSPREIRVQATLWATVEGSGRERGTKQICPVTKPTFDTSLSHLSSTSLPSMGHNCDNCRVGLASISEGVILRGQKFL